MGRVYRAYWTKSGVLDAHGKPKRFYSKSWTIEFTDASGKTIHRKAGSKEQAKDALKKAEGSVLAEKNDLPTERVGDVNPAVLLKRYTTSLSTRASEAHVKAVTGYIEEVLAALRAVTMRDIRPEGVESYLNELSDKELGSKAINARLEAMNSFLNWLVKKARVISFNPLNPVSKLAEIDSPRRRRALSEDEVIRLLAAAVDGPRRRAVRQSQNRPRKDGTFKPVEFKPERAAALAEEGRRTALLYRMALETGLRRSELKALTWADLDLEVGTVTTRPEWVGNKNAKRETLPLSPGLLTELKVTHTENKPKPVDHVLNVTSRTLDCFNDDLVAAGMAQRIPVDAAGEAVPVDQEGRPLQTPHKWILDKRDAQGRTLDLHAMRHTFGTRLGRLAGVDPKTVQTLMRHSDPRLTFGTYVHSDRERLKDAVGRLPSLAIKGNFPTSGQQAKPNPFSPDNVTYSSAVGCEIAPKDGEKDHTHEVTGSNPVAPTIFKIWLFRKSVERLIPGQPKTCRVQLTVQTDDLQKFTPNRSI